MFTTSTFYVHNLIILKKNKTHFYGSPQIQKILNLILYVIDSITSPCFSSLTFLITIEIFLFG